MHCLLKMLLVLYLVKCTSSRSHQYYRNVLSRMSTTFGRALFSCGHVIPMTQHLLMEFYHFWDTKRPLSEQFGCLAGCTAWKMGLMSGKGGQDARFKGFITRHGGDALLVYRFKELLFDCAQVINKKRFKNTCHSAKEIATCLRTGIAYYHWTPTLSDIYRYMIKKKTRRVLNGSDNTESTKNSTPSMKFHHNVTPTEKTNRHILSSTNTKDDLNIQLTTPGSFHNTETDALVNNSHYTPSTRNSSSSIKIQYHNVTTTEPINTIVLNSTSNKTFNITITNINDDQSIQETTPVSLLNTVIEIGSETYSTEELPIQDHISITQTEIKHSKYNILHEIFVEINTTNEFKVDAMLLREMLERIEERERIRDIEL